MCCCLWGTRREASQRDLSDPDFLFFPLKELAKVCKGYLLTKQRGVVHICSRKMSLQNLLLLHFLSESADKRAEMQTLDVFIPFTVIFYIILPFSRVYPSIFLLAAAYQDHSGSWRVSQQSLDGSPGHTRGGHVNSIWKATCGGFL